MTVATPRKGASQVRVGCVALRPPETDAVGGIVELDGKSFYRIQGLDRMQPFLMTMVSDSDHWMFLSSTGALTAGRRSPERSLFPYTTEDKIHDSLDLTGPKTVILVEGGDGAALWEPFSCRFAGAYRIRRSLYKSVLGNQIVFRERNLDLGVGFQYRWSFSERFGFVRSARLWNEQDGGLRVRVLDGIQNVLPAGVEPGLQAERSNLIDAYKKSELEPGTGLGIFSLSSIPVDRPEARESLRATTVWSTVEPSSPRLLSCRQLDAFRLGGSVERETDLRATRGAYFVAFDRDLPEEGSAEWHIVAEVGQSAAAVSSLVAGLSAKTATARLLEADIERGSEDLLGIVAAADGLQATADPLNDARHSANVLFNVMRGGIYADGYLVDGRDLGAFVREHNRHVWAAHGSLWDALSGRIDLEVLRRRVEQVGDPQLTRLCNEYLPLTFSRRHGDPSRPWNHFSIETRRADGSRVLNYEGNWRDIFQNWEALSVSYPGFLGNVIARFLNASTIDGYNPYRITRRGIDWEVHEPDDPWSFIGYWGDHQVIYLLKLLELAHAHERGSLLRMMGTREFAYANVPYRIRGYDDLLADPHETVDLDSALAARIEKRVRTVGADGRLVWDDRGHVRLVNLTEKLLVTLLAKLTNFIPEAGIWMNTQRPEWNDANNALVGRGASVVTLCHLRRFLAFACDLYGDADLETISVAAEVVSLADSVRAVLARHEGSLRGPLDDRLRKNVLDGLGRAGEAYRKAVYAAPAGTGDASLHRKELVTFFQLALRWVDHSIRANRREDGLYHAYNVIATIDEDTLVIGRLQEMLEGQVAALTSGLLEAEEAVDLLDTLRGSALYREDQSSYLLYPDQARRLFLERGRVSPDAAERSQLIRELLAAGECSLVEPDVSGGLHWAGDLRNAGDVESILDRLSASGREKLVESERSLILDLFEIGFQHARYTGRSSAFYGYEGLGCIYWHMVSKLLLAVAEVHAESVRAGVDPVVLRRLAARYHDIRSGLSAHKGPAVHGALPMDPYSHTPGSGVARQPGLTGQVKEDVLARWGELGVTVREGRIEFRPALLREEEFACARRPFAWVDLKGQTRSVDLDADTLGFTYCQTPVVYRRSGSPSIRVIGADGVIQVEGLVLPREISREVFMRSGAVERIEVFLGPPAGP